MNRNITTVALMAALALPFLSGGCTVTKIEMADGTKFASHRFADWTKIGRLDVGVGTNTFTLEGYDSDRQTAGIEAMKVAQQALDLAAKAAVAP